MRSFITFADTILTGLFTALVCVIPIILTTSLVYKRMSRALYSTRSSFRAAHNTQVEDDSLYDCTAQEAERNATMHRIYQITSLLRRRLNADVARMIVVMLDEHEIYRQRRRPNDPLNIREANSPQPCFVGTAIQARARTQHPVRRVVFRFESRDQGWVTDRDSGSWSWFTAAVIPATDEDLDRTDYDQTDLMFNAPGIYHGDDANNDRDREYGRRNPMYESLVRERVVFRNNLESFPVETNTVVWTSDSDVEEEADWVQSLRRGDRIVVRAWAQFPGWENNVHGTSVSIYNTAVA